MTSKVVAIFVSFLLIAVTCLITFHGGLRKAVVENWRGRTFPSQNGAPFGKKDHTTLRGTSQTRILCMINHKPTNDDRAEAVLATWAKRCDGYAFVSTQQRPGSPTVVLENRTESRQILWAKVQAMIRYAYSKLNDYEWFLKADDDTYVIVENLRHFLANHSTDEPVYFGAEFKQMIRNGFLSGGAGYVFSRSAIRQIVRRGFDTKRCNLTDNEVEEIRLEECARKVGVSHRGDTVDQRGRGRFFPYEPQRHFTPGNEDLNGWLQYRLGHHFDCCSDSAISFHYITPINMYILDYFIYRLKVYV